MIRIVVCDVKLNCMTFSRTGFLYLSFILFTPLRKFVEIVRLKGQGQILCKVRRYLSLRAGDEKLFLLLLLLVPAYW